MDEATILLGLATSLNGQEKYTEAADLYRKVLALAKSDKDRASVLAALGGVSSRIGKDAEAEDYFRQALALLPDGDPHRATVLVGIGAACINQGKPKEAEEAYRDALGGSGAVNSSEGPQILAGLSTASVERVDQRHEVLSSGLPDIRINSSPPANWQKLQDDVRDLLRECGITADSDQTIETVRGNVDVDVLASDNQQQPVTTYIIECKRWDTRVPKTVVHAFRSVVHDYGANWGLIISSKGFQSGAFDAAKNSNIRLLNWIEFQTLFADRWTENYLRPRLRAVADPLVEFCEPDMRSLLRANGLTQKTVNHDIFDRADRLPEDKRLQFIALRERYRDLAFLTVPYYLGSGILQTVKPELQGTITPILPLRKLLAEFIAKGTTIPDDVLDSDSLRGFLEVVSNHCIEGVAAFRKCFE